MLNIVQATFDALAQLKSPETVAIERGKDVKDVTPYWDRRKNG
jgi:small subunit ribosomal protein S5